jgi:hypothetical protein
MVGPNFAYLNSKLPNSVLPLRRSEIPDGESGLTQMLPIPPPPPVTSLSPRYRHLPTPDAHPDLITQMP